MSVVTQNQHEQDIVTVETREALEALKPGALMTCRDGYAMTRNHDGEFALWGQRAAGWGWIFFDVNEITGDLFRDEEPDYESRFFPITVTL